MKDFLGVDVLNVIIEGRDSASQISGKDYLNAPEVDGAIEGLAELARLRFGQHIQLFTRCQRKSRQRRIEWLDHHNFWERVGIPRVLPMYCWTPEYKADVCRDKGITHFVDDDPLELLHLYGLVENLYLFRPTEENLREYARFIASSGTMQVDSWRSINHELLVRRI
jgi:hypothetical protein